LRIRQVSQQFVVAACGFKAIDSALIIRELY
jgi:hypothetical protein